jgi:hypothetical protein
MRTLLAFNFPFRYPHLQGFLGDMWRLIRFGDGHGGFGWQRVQEPGVEVRWDRLDGQSLYDEG